MRLSYEGLFVAAGAYAAYLLRRPAAPLATLIRAASAASYALQCAVLYLFPAACWAWGAGAPFAALVSALFWGAPALLLFDEVCARAVVVLPRRMWRANSAVLERMAAQCPICWAPLQAGGALAARGDSASTSGAQPEAAPLAAGDAQSAPGVASGAHGQQHEGASSSSSGGAASPAECQRPADKAGAPHVEADPAGVQVGGTGERQSGGVASNDGEYAGAALARLDVAPSTLAERVRGYMAPSVDGGTAPGNKAPSAAGDTAPGYKAPSVDGDTAPGSKAPSAAGDTAPASVAPSADSETAPRVAAAAESSHGAPAAPDKPPANLRRRMGRWLSRRQREGGGGAAEGSSGRAEVSMRGAPSRSHSGAHAGPFEAQRERLRGVQDGAPVTRKLASFPLPLSPPGSPAPSPRRRHIFRQKPDSADAGGGEDPFAMARRDAEIRAMTADEALAIGLVIPRNTGGMQLTFADRGSVVLPERLSPRKHSDAPHATTAAAAGPSARAAPRPDAPAASAPQGNHAAAGAGLAMPAFLSPSARTPPDHATGVESMAAAPGSDNSAPGVAPAMPALLAPLEESPAAAVSNGDRASPAPSLAASSHSGSVSSDGGGAPGPDGAAPLAAARCGDETPVTLACGHAFHFACTTDWLHQCKFAARPPACPVCQAKVDVRTRFLPRRLLRRRRPRGGSAPGDVQVRATFCCLCRGRGCTLGRVPSALLRAGRGGGR